jgi:hypothetical protein
VLTVGVLAHHVIATAVLLDRHITLGTLLRIGRNPIGRFRIVVALFDPLLQQPTLDRIVPIFAAFKAKDVATLARHRPRIDVLHLDGERAIGGGTPAQQTIALDKAVGDQQLVFEFDTWICHQPHDGHIVDQNVAAVGSAGDGLAQTLLHDFGGQVFGPAGGAKAVATLQSGHHLGRNTQFHQWNKFNAKRRYIVCFVQWNRTQQGQENVFTSNYTQGHLHDKNAVCTRLALRTSLTVGGKCEKQMSQSSVPVFLIFGLQIKFGLLNGLMTWASLNSLSWSAS